MRNLLEVEFATEHDAWVRFCFHPEERVQAVAEWLLSNTAPPVMLLAGQPASGRSYLLEAGIHRARLTGKRYHLHLLDLAGFGDGLARGLELEIERARARRQERRRKRLEALRGIAKEAEVEVPKLPWLVLVVALAAPVQLVRSFLPEKTGPIRGTRFSDPDIIGKLCDALCEEGPVVLLIPDGTPLLNVSDRKALLYEAKQRSDLRVAMLCRPSDDPHLLAPKCDYDKLDVLPFDRRGFEAMLSLRFPHRFPAPLVDALGRYAQGQPGLAAAKLADLWHRRLIAEDQEGMWSLTGGDASAPDVVGALDRDLLWSCEELIHRTGGPVADLLAKLLDLGALSGEVFPAGLIFDYLEADKDLRDSIIDLIDENLAAEGDFPLLIDHELRHPAFPGVQTYAFANPLLRRAVLLRLERKTASLAKGFLAFLRRQGSPQTRGMGSLEIELAGFLESQEERDSALREIGLWVEAEQADELREMVVEDLCAGRLTAERAIELVKRMGNAYPHRCWAMLDAVGVSGMQIPQPLLLEFVYECAKALYRLGRFAQAVSEATQARRLAESQFGVVSLPAVEALHLLGKGLAELGDLAGARRELEQALAEARQLAETGDIVVAAVLRSLASVLKELGDLSTARRLAEQALERHRWLFGEEHMSTIGSLEMLAMVLYLQGFHAGARRMFEQVLDQKRCFFGGDHLQVAVSLANLALVLRTEGDLPRSRELLEEALEMEWRHIGPGHPGVATSLTNLAEVMRTQGDLTAARKHLERALEIQRRHFVEEHLDVAFTLMNLSWVLQGQGDLTMARTLAKQALDIHSRMVGEERFDLARSAYALTNLLEELGERSNAILLLREAEVAARRLPADHPLRQQIDRRLMELSTTSEPEADTAESAR